MTIETWKNRASWLALVGGILLSGAMAQAQQQAPAEEALPAPRAARSDRWIGLSCYPADAVLRAQLKLPKGEGLVVEAVAPDGPAAKQGIEAGDILLKVGDQPLAEVADLAKAINGAGEKALTLDVLRNGEHKPIDVVPGVRAKEPEPVVLPLDDIGVRQLIGRAREAIPRLGGLRDVVVMRPGLPVHVQFPADLSVSINKQGDESAKVTVKKGEQSWEVTEETLAKLPDEVRGYVEMFMGRMPTLPLPPDLAKTFDLKLPPPPGFDAAASGKAIEEAHRRLHYEAGQAERRLRDEAGQVERRLRDEAGPIADRLQERLQSLEKQLQERLQQVEKRIEELQKPAATTPPNGTPENNSAKDDVSKDDV